MKKGNLILTVFCITLLAMVTGCGGRGGQAETQVARGEPVNYEEWIEGTWRAELAVESIRFQNGIFYESLNGRFRISGRYEVEENIITLRIGGLTDLFPHIVRARLYFNGQDRLIIRNNYGEIEYTRVIEP